MTIFALFSQQRSGTGALTSFISHHPQVQNVAEILNPANLEHEDNFFRYWANSDPRAMIELRRSPSDLFQDFLSNLELKYQGKDILLDITLNSIRHVLNYWEELPGYGNIGMPWVVDLFRRQNYPLLYLYRANHLDRFVSSKIAELTGIYRSSDRATSAKARFEVNTDEMMAYILNGEESHNLFVKCVDHFKKSLSLNYEESFVAGGITPSVKVDLARFFGFNLQPYAEPFYVKQRLIPLDSVILNYAEVCTRLESADRGFYASI